MIARFLLAGLACSLLLATASLGQPAGQSTLREEDLRVAAAAYRIALAGRPLCSEAHPLTGLLFHHLAEYLPADRQGLIADYHLDRGPGVSSVVADSPAARAGIVAGDVLLTVNGAPFPSSVTIATQRDPNVKRKQIEASELQLEEQLRTGPVRLLVLRDGHEMNIVLDSVPGCIGRIRLMRLRKANAYAIRGYVAITTKMLNFLRSDDELAVVLSHEMSHNILRHTALLDEQGVPRKGLMRGIGKNAERVWKTEAEADRLGIRLMANAGYDVGAAIPFWRRYLGKYDFFPQIFRTHPSLGARERITREAIAALAGPPPPPQP